MDTAEKAEARNTQQTLITTAFAAFSTSIFMSDLCIVFSLLNPKDNHKTKLCMEFFECLP